MFLAKREKALSLPTFGEEEDVQKTHITSFVKSKKSTTSNEDKSKAFSTLDFEEFEDFGDRSHKLGPVFHGIVKNIRRNVNNGLNEGGDKTKGLLIKRDTEEKEISENEKEHPHPQQNHHPHQTHHEEENMVETESDRTEATESIGFRVLEFFGTIAGLVWGVMTNVMKFVASGSSAAAGASSGGSS
uniref:Uncharacterized protein n=1 Tax=Megaselia scalaris TaxID=36166 RepID=T1GY63_MEGSC